MTRPLIGITTYLTSARYGAWETEAALVPADYVNAVERAGGRPLLVPPSADGIEETPPVHYVQAATLNGRPLETTYIRAADVHNGGVLHLELGQEPSPWGRSARPPSLSDARPGGAT